jgi:hypothetical protein
MEETPQQARDRASIARWARDGHPLPASVTAKLELAALTARRVVQRSYDVPRDHAASRGIAVYAGCPVGRRHIETGR